jgi:hypothetical protein
MSYDPTGPYGPDPNYQQPWQQPTEPQYGVPSPGPNYPPPPQPGYPTSGAAYPTSGPGYPTSGGGAPPPPGYPQTGYVPTPPQGPKKNTALIITLVAVIAVVLCGGGIAVTAIVVSRDKPNTGATAGSTPTTGGGTTGTGPTTGGGGGGGGGVSTSGTIAFGADHGVKWDDKVEASVISVVRYTPSKNAAGTHPGQVGIKVTVKITNNSTKQLDVTLARVKVKSGANGTQADTIIDLENNLGLGFEGKIAPNNAATAVYGFSIPSGDLSKIDVEVSPDFDHDSGIFEGSVS